MSQNIKPEEVPVDLVQEENASFPAPRVFCDTCSKMLVTIKKCKHCITLNSSNKAGQENIPVEVDPSFEPDSIVEVTESNGELTFVMKRKDSEEVYPIPSKIANVKYSQLVLKFYEQRLESVRSIPDNMDQLKKSG